MTNNDILLARELLGYDKPRQLAAALGRTPRFVQKIEAGADPIQPIVALAVECLLRRAELWQQFQQRRPQNAK